MRRPYISLRNIKTRETARMAGVIEFLRSQVKNRSVTKGKRKGGPLIIGVNCSSNLIAVGGNFSQASKDFPMREPMREASDKSALCRARARSHPRPGSLARSTGKLGAADESTIFFSQGLLARDDDFSFLKKFSLYLTRETPRLSEPLATRRNRK